MKMQIWKKKGLVFKNFTKKKWSDSHCMLPTPLMLKKGIYRVFVGTRNRRNQSCIAYLDLKFSTNNKFTVIHTSSKPCFNPGKIGSFDDNGVLPSCVIKEKKLLHLFYIGWKPGGTTRYSLIAGHAISKNNGKNFFRTDQSSILKTNNNEPYEILTAPFVCKVNKKFYMWYVSCNRWINKNYPTYDIKLAISNNLINWKQTGLTCINLKKNERAVARPYVIFEKNKFKMWYSYEKKGKKYKIGYAESNNGKRWIRKDKKIKFAGRYLWDKDMMAYSAVIKVNFKKFMFYNGNNYGKRGFGAAELIRDIK